MEFSSVFEELQARGLIAQLTHAKEIPQILKDKKVTVYAGFDPTADSLHIGHLLPIIVLSHFQRYGHRVIALAGGGTALIGDPTGKTEMRDIVSPEQIDKNLEGIRRQLKKFLDLNAEKGLLVNNADWIRPLNYVEFLRDVGRHFSVNRMLTAECFKARLEKGLSFIEFNYMLLQSYDFLHLNREEGCTFQVGGDDQWSNILSGMDLVRRVGQKESFGMTGPLLITSDGKKMGKTEKGALWLSAEKTTPYDFFQYFRNVADADVIRVMKMMTFLPLTEINRFESAGGQELNEAKKVLAFEMTRLVHGRENADEARQAAEALFGGGAAGGAIPAITVPAADLKNGMLLVDLLVKAGLCGSKSDARRQIQGNAISVNSVKAIDTAMLITAAEVIDSRVELKKGKKHFCHVIVS